MNNSLSAKVDRVMLDNPPFGDFMEFWKLPNGKFASPKRPDTFSLRVSDDRVELDWLETRSYFVRAKN